MRSMLVVLLVLAFVPTAAPSRFEWDGPRFDGAPMIRLSYGFAERSHDDLEGELADPVAIELELGSAHWSDAASGIVDYTSNGVSFSYSGSDLGGGDDEDKAFETEAWAVGLFSYTGIGYRIRASALTPYSGGRLGFYRLGYDREVMTGAEEVSGELSDEDFRRLGFFHEEFRLATSAEGGVRARIGPMVEVGLGYERMTVMQRWLPWKWLGSVMTEALAQEALDEFIGAIRDRTPAAAPIVAFVLKNGLSYGIYELRQEDMNWPFGDAPPLAQDTFKLSVSFAFR